MRDWRGHRRQAADSGRRHLLNHPVAWLFLVSAGLAAQTDPTATFTPSDLEHGKKLFRAHCAPCHGIDGTGGRGANLAVPKLRRAADNAAIFTIAQYGIEGTSMDGAWQLSDGELWRIVAYVRSLAPKVEATLPGDPVRGRAVYEQQGCADCHIIAGKGSSLGPELTAVGAQRSAAYLRESIIKPAADVPPEFVSVRLVTNDGNQISGIRVNEDSFTIQIKDLNNRFHSLRKSELAVFELQLDQSAMPVYGGLSPQQLDDLVAYLASLRGGT